MTILVGGAKMHTLIEVQQTGQIGVKGFAESGPTLRSRSRCAYATRSHDEGLRRFSSSSGFPSQCRDKLLIQVGQDEFETLAIGSPPNDLRVHRNRIGGIVPFGACPL